MTATAPTHRRQLAIELAVCTLLVAAFSVYALWRMDYLSPGTAEHIRMTDNTRTAYVAKNIVEGRGYTTDELPAFLVDFYQQRGMLHQDNWPNADRFPFTAYAIAALDEVTRSTSYEVGILGYNLICFVAFLVLLYWFTRAIWNDRWAALAALAIALLHPLTYLYLYAKDADMLLLTLGVMAAFVGYFRRPADELSWKRALGMGTVLGWLCLARPNIGMAFALYFGVLILRRIWKTRDERGWGGAIAAVARREGIVVGVVVLWCLPFMIHCMAVWGSPMFSANALYQLPLGTRYAMDTDTWWKYSEPGTLITLGTLVHHVPGELVLKFTTSWGETLRSIVEAYALELVLGCAVLASLMRRKEAPPADPTEVSRETALLRVAKMVGFVFALNFVLLPLYGYQHTAFRYYLSFFLPLIWVACGKAVVIIVMKLRPVFADAFARVRGKPAVWLALVVVALLLVNITTKATEANVLVAATPMFMHKHWLVVTLAIVAILLLRPISRLRWRSFGAIAAAVVAFVVVRYQPNVDVKRGNVVWFPLDDKVWDVLRERHGLVMSLAMQSEVNWASGRKNIPAPEYMMHVYSLLFDHELEVEDVYIESAQTLVGPSGGAFIGAAPGFESYARMEKYQGRLPGYDIVFHTAGVKTYAKYRIRGIAKESTIYRLVDRDAVRAMGQSPSRIELGKTDNVIYTAHGWGEYLSIDGKPLVAATTATRERYIAAVPHRPWEDTSVTFFLDDRRPTSVDLEIYATHPTKLDFYWNLDLYAYDTRQDRAKHAIGSYQVTNLGWQTIHLEIPAGVTRKGFNKLGFRSSSFKSFVLCPTGMNDAVCAAQNERPIKTVPTDAFPIVVHDDHATTVTPMFVSLLAGTLEFHYAGSTAALPGPHP